MSEYCQMLMLRQSRGQLGSKASNHSTASRQPAIREARFTCVVLGHVRNLPQPFRVDLPMHGVRSTYFERHVQSRFSGRRQAWVTMVAWVLLSPAFALAAENLVTDDTAVPARIYTTQEERRGAGLEHRITEALTLSALAELEYRDGRYRQFGSSYRNAAHDFSKTLQLGLNLKPRPSVKAELIYEYQVDTMSERHRIDEAMLAFEGRNLELEVGRLNLPFGAYLSHFASGPLLDFGETRGDAAVLSYKAHDRLDLSAFWYQGRTEKLGANDSNRDFGLALESLPFPFLKFGMSYLSDLADSKERLLRGSDNRYQRRVDAVSVYAVGDFDRFEASAEFVGALGSFTELDADRNRPRAWNLELSFFPVRNLEVSLRFEASKELEGAPRRQSGLAFAWRVKKNASLTVEYLSGSFQRGFAQDSSGSDIDRIERFGTQFGLAF